MENKQKDQSEAVKELHKYAESLLVEQKKSPEETKHLLVKDGLDEESASAIVEHLVTQINEVSNEKAYKDIWVGLAWALGGLIANYSGVGFVFWGAVLYGAVRLFKGLAILIQVNQISNNNSET
tara:strand:+ start:3428 stop:3799 length:372 start_codon:yes stop_codon:yes gene_type:complete